MPPGTGAGTGPVNSCSLRGDDDFNLNSRVLCSLHSLSKLVSGNLVCPLLGGTFEMCVYVCSRVEHILFDPVFGGYFSAVMRHRRRYMYIMYV